MDRTEIEYLHLHVMWRSEIKPPEDAEIDESVFEEIYRMQEGQNVCIKDENWISERKI